MLPSPIAALRDVVADLVSAKQTAWDVAFEAVPVIIPVFKENEVTSRTVMVWIDPDAEEQERGAKGQWPERVNILLSVIIPIKTTAEFDDALAFGNLLFELSFGGLQITLADPAKVIWTHDAPNEWLTRYNPERLHAQLDRIEGEWVTNMTGKFVAVLSMPFRRIVRQGG